MNNLENLKRALGAFMEDMWLPFEDSISFINLDIENGMIDKEKLKKEFKESMGNVSFNWEQLATDTQLLVSPNNYSNIEICNYVKWLIQDYLFPKQVMSESNVKKLYTDTLSILKHSSDTIGWIEAYQLYASLKTKSDYYDFEYYNFWKLDFNKEIERKSILGKDREIGYLRYKGS